MTDAALSAPRPDPLARMLADEPRFTRFGLFLAASLAVTLLALQLDTRVFQGESVWVKPVKFQIALILYTLTLAFFARWLPASLTARPLWRLYAAIVVIAIVAELAWIGGAAMLGTASHFNLSSPLWMTLYSLMGFLAVTLTSASLVMGLLIWRNPATGLPPALRLALVLGLILTFVLTVAVAGYMSSHLSHHVGTPVTGARVWGIGWSREVGDLRVSHFFATHAMHAVPLAGLAAATLLPPRTATAAVLAAAILYAAFVGFTFWQAVNGVPFLS